VTHRYVVPHCRVSLRHIEATLEDAYLVTRWRNSPEARRAFFNTDVVTPDTHLRFMATRRAHDLVFVAEAQVPGWVAGRWQNDAWAPIGMGGLTVDVLKREAEWGRVYLDPIYRGKGYGTDLVYLALGYAFELLALDRIWADIWTTNDPILKVYDRVGLQPVGVNLPGHEHPGGDVITREFTAEMWTEFGRLAFEKRRQADGVKA
jgi:RimJ/RimL family protein N-acetyltransferase